MLRAWQSARKFHTLYYDGRTIRYCDPIVKVNDTVKVDIATEILDTIPFKVTLLLLLRERILAVLVLFKRLMSTKDLSILPSSRTPMVMFSVLVSKMYSFSVMVPTPQYRCQRDRVWDWLSWKRLLSPTKRKKKLKKELSCFALLGSILLLWRFRRYSSETS